MFFMAAEVGRVELGRRCITWPIGLVCQRRAVTVDLHRSEANHGSVARRLWAGSSRLESSVGRRDDPVQEASRPGRAAVCATSWCQAGQRCPALRIAAASKSPIVARHYGTFSMRSTLVIRRGRPSVVDQYRQISDATRIFRSKKISGNVGVRA